MRLWLYCLCSIQAQRSRLLLWPKQRQRVWRLVTKTTPPRVPGPSEGLSSSSRLDSNYHILQNSVVESRTRWPLLFCSVDVTPMILSSMDSFQHARHFLVENTLMVSESMSSIPVSIFRFSSGLLSLHHHFSRAVRILFLGGTRSYRYDPNES